MNLKSFTVMGFPTFDRLLQLTKVLYNFGKERSVHSRSLRLKGRNQVLFILEEVLRTCMVIADDVAVHKPSGAVCGGLAQFYTYEKKSPHWDETVTDLDAYNCLKHKRLCISHQEAELLER